ncbi:MAG: HNH endonuclease [Ardenticatenaceae bacterium]|nr:HNH endonuclease [Ardenticatenaceae bacterium]HBY92834.1 HNH endonuclease [Chloroflexota bacterium]
MGSVLVLNASYEPLNIISVKRAIVLLLKEKAELLEAAEATLRSEHIALRVPLVIRLVNYVRIPGRLGIPLTRRTVMTRDHHTCQYCGAQPGKHALTLDHVVPRARGGQTTWENIVLACAPCNQRKGNRLPGEASMRLMRQPFRPRYMAIALLGETNTSEVWSKYLLST